MHQPLHILLIDDYEVAMAPTIEYLTEFCNCNIQQKITIGSAIDLILLEKTSFDLIIIDMIMPLSQEEIKRFEHIIASRGLKTVLSKINDYAGIIAFDAISEITEDIPVFIYSVIDIEDPIARMLSNTHAVYLEKTLITPSKLCKEIEAIAQRKDRPT